MTDGAKPRSDGQGRAPSGAALRLAVGDGLRGVSGARPAAEPMGEMAAKLDVVRDFIARSGDDAAAPRIVGGARKTRAVVGSH